MLIVIACLVVGLILGGLYLLVVPRKYVAVSKLIVERLAPGFVMSGMPSPADRTTDPAADAQAEVLRSPAVLRVAEANGNLGELAMFKGVRDPVAIMRRDLRVEASSRGNLLTVTFLGTQRDDAARVVDAIVAAYQSYQSDQRQRASRELAKGIEVERAELETQLAAARRNLAGFEASPAAPVSTEAATQRIAALADALTKAQLETFTARRAYDEAMGSSRSSLAGLNEKELEQALQEAGVNAPDSPELIEQEIGTLSRQLTDLKKTYAENHPAVVRATQRLRQVRLTQVASTRQRWLATQAREADLKKTLDQIQRESAGQSVRTAEREKLAAEVARLSSRDEELRRRLSDILLSTTAGSLHVEVITPAETTNPDYPALPRPTPTLVTTGLLGLVLGGLFALLGEFRSSGTTIREALPLLKPDAPTPDAAGAALGMKVLATLDDAGSEAANGSGSLAWSAQLDPFGPVANAVRTLRRSMEVDGQLPATILLTSASPAEGKTTLAVNLATTIAREGRKVLLIDLNFDHPQVAHVLEVAGERGLTDLLRGGDAVELIRSTAIARLDVLPAGARPADAVALLNSDAFPQALSMLSAAYDHVIFDGNALSHGDDARIVASVCDGTVLVSKATASAVRRAAGARDLLLTIGANLLGVVLMRGGARTYTSSDAGRTGSTQHMSGLG